MLLSLASSLTQARTGHDNNVQDDDGNHQLLSNDRSHIRKNVA
ncbi:MAG: hypothetical protein VX699_08005 [Myxococcota bacterium]|nr:hypothetical protein [Myxococcota bacterium]